MIISMKYNVQGKISMVQTKVRSAASLAPRSLFFRTPDVALIFCTSATMCTSNGVLVVSYRAQVLLKVVNIFGACV